MARIYDAKGLGINFHELALYNFAHIKSPLKTKSVLFKILVGDGSDEFILFLFLIFSSLIETLCQLNRSHRLIGHQHLLHLGKFFFSIRLVLLLLGKAQDLVK